MAEPLTIIGIILSSMWTTENIHLETAVIKHMIATKFCRLAALKPLDIKHYDLLL